LKNKDPWKKTKRRTRKLLILVGWSFLAFLVYQASQFDYEYANFDPYDILQVSPVSDVLLTVEHLKPLNDDAHPRNVS
jgi:translocation protein SEC63